MMLTPCSCGFQSTPLMRGATTSSTRCAMTCDFNPRPSCEGRRPADAVFRCIGTISIHAPHARGDQRHRSEGLDHWHFNPRPSCEGRPRHSWCLPMMAYFNPRPSCEGRHHGMDGALSLAISIHAPHARGDPPFTTTRHGLHDFNPRPSCEGRPVSVRAETSALTISIHAPHARGDTSLPSTRMEMWSFQSTPLMRGATAWRSRAAAQGLFQSTPLMRGATRS